MLVFALALVSSGPALPDPDACRRALAAAPAYSVCAPTGNGVALAGDRKNADALAAHARAGEARFRTYFGRTIAPYAITSTPPALDGRALRAAGFVHVLPWPDPESFERATREGIERAARQFGTSQGMTAAQIDQVVARALANAGADGGKAALDAGMVPHELGHLWFTHAFWPDAGKGESAGTNHYGGPGPDWLDELAAILMEDEPTATRRRAQFRSLLAGEVLPAIGPVAGRETMLDLKGFLSRAHPALSRVLSAPPKMPAGGGIALVYTPAGGGGVNSAVQERLFYIQARAFADFMLERTGRPTVFAEIAESLAQGRSFEAWLGTRGPALGLPATIDALDAQWRAKL
ncbi:hypothetical protein TPR58_16990 [Sphingomonas sp. HF-S3]|uniref:Peptidase M1 membrane alanine aminopeptidase domain-containing protein n=1 Tax=Sphingomonas rustica TaxID=3103142 RepID=A0ABV0BBE4_9SPHN